MDQDTIRVGIIGAGNNTRRKHIPGLQKQNDVEVVAVANRTLGSGQRVADQFSIPTAYGDWREIVYSDEIDAVCIGTWPYMHAPLTIATLDAGKHVLVEARMAMNSMEALAMLETSKATPGQVAQIVPAPHTLSVDATIIDMISDGYIGDLITLNAQIAQPRTFAGADSPVHWRHDRDLSGNNIMSMGIWYEAMSRWVGPAKTVSAIGQSVVKHRKDDSGRRRAMTIPDHLDIIGNMEVGGQMRFSVSSVLSHVPTFEVFIHGTEGTIRLTDTEFVNPQLPVLSLSAARSGDAELSEIQIPEDKVGSWRVEEEFINAIRGVEQITHTSFADGLKYMEWTDAVTRSLRTGETVHLPLDVN